MKKLSFVLLLCCVVTIVGLSSASARAEQRRNLDFTLVNKTGVVVFEVYLSPTRDDEWGEDVMGEDILDVNDKVAIKFSSEETDCSWDLKIVDEDDDEIVWAKLNLCTANEISLLYEDGKPTAIIK